MGAAEIKQRPKKKRKKKGRKRGKAKGNTTHESIIDSWRIHAIFMSNPYLGTWQAVLKYFSTSVLALTLGACLQCRRQAVGTFLFFNACVRMRLDRSVLKRCSFRYATNGSTHSSLDM